MAEPEIGGIWRLLPHEATPAEFARWDEARTAEERDLYTHKPEEDYVRTEGIDYITNGSAAEQKALFAQLEQNRQSRVFGTQPIEQDWGEIARQHNRALERSDDLISTPIDPRRQEERDYLSALGHPQRFPLTEDGLVTQRVKQSGPFNGGDIDSELSVARYRDWEFQRDHQLVAQQPRRTDMPDAEADRQANAYWESLLNRERQSEQNGLAYAATATQKQAPQPAVQNEAVQRQALLL